MGAQLGTSSMRDELFIKSDAFVPESRAFLQDTSSISQYHFKTTYNLLKRNLPPSIGATYSFIRERDFPLVVNIQIFFSLSLSLSISIFLFIREGSVDSKLVSRNSESERQRERETSRLCSQLIVMCQERKVTCARAIRSLLRSPFARLLRPFVDYLTRASRAESYAYRPRPVHELYLYPAPGSLADIDAARPVGQRVLFP